MSPLLAHHAPHTQVAFGGGGARTAQQLEGLSRAIACRLDGPRAAGCVVVACSDRYFFAASLLAAWSRGLCVALPSNTQVASVHALVARLDAVALLHDRDEAPGIDVRAAERDVQVCSERLPMGLARSDLALIAFTSGSTGEPQPHDKSLAQLLDEACMLAAHFELTGCRVLSAVPPHHIYGLLFGVLVPLSAGGAMSRTSPLLPADVIAHAAREHADVLVAVPPHLRSLAQHEAAPATGLRRVFSSGAPLSDDVARALAGRGLRVTQVFGSTETGGIAFRDEGAAPWRALPSVAVSRDTAGALCVDSPWLSAKVARPMQTQDRIALTDSGFVLLGRTDNVVKVGGRRVDLGELEAKLCRIDGVRDARVLAEPGDAARGVTLLAVVEADAGHAAVLRDQLAATVDPVVMPRRFRVVPALPRTATGKVTREALLALFDTWHCPTETDVDGRVHIRVPANLGFFRGHFDGQPILPGVFQLHFLALGEARRRWSELGPLLRVTRVKFKRPVAPGESLVLTLMRKGDLLVDFNLACGDEPAASGLLHFAATGAQAVADA